MSDCTHVQHATLQGTEYQAKSMFATRRAFWTEAVQKAKWDTVNGRNKKYVCVLWSVKVQMAHLT